VAVWWVLRVADTFPWGKNLVKVAAYQAPLLPSGSMEAVALIAREVRRCEAAGVDLLCCPEGVLGGLADNAAKPGEIALGVESGQLADALAPLASDTVATIVGFTELSPTGDFFNSAALFHRGLVAGVYRKLHPAIRRSVYRPGEQVPVFTVGGLTFGIVICYDSTFPELARSMALRGAAALFVPTNNALPAGRADVSGEARMTDVCTATETGMWVVRADVAGRAGGLVSQGSSAIVAPGGTVVRSARRLAAELLMADIGMPSRPAGSTAERSV